MDFHEHLEESKRSQAPVRNTVSENGRDIQKAREKGHSLSAIFRALKKSGIEAGKNYSSFSNAIKWLDKNGWPHEHGEPLEPPIQTASSPGVPGPTDVPAVTRADDGSHIDWHRPILRNGLMSSFHRLACQIFLAALFLLSYRVTVAY